MIKTVRNQGNKVIGISINNKRYQLPREVCHALSIEELNEKNKVSKTTIYADEAKDRIRSHNYVGESGGLRLLVNFNDDKTVDTHKGKIEFIKEMQLLHPKERALCMRLVENLLEALNQATKLHNNDLEKLMQNISKEIAS